MLRCQQVTPVVSTNCISVGEALRVIDHKDVIKNDFVLISGDTVSNTVLAPALEAHRQRREKDKNAIMTMVRWGELGWVKVCEELLGRILYCMQVLCEELLGRILCMQVWAGWSCKCHRLLLCQINRLSFANCRP